jgi:hypothetical protein
MATTPGSVFSLPAEYRPGPLERLACPPTREIKSALLELTSWHVVWGF